MPVDADWPSVLSQQPDATDETWCISFLHGNNSLIFLALSHCSQHASICRPVGAITGRPSAALLQLTNEVLLPLRKWTHFDQSSSFCVVELLHVFVLKPEIAFLKKISFMNYSIFLKNRFS